MRTATDIVRLFAIFFSIPCWSGSDKKATDAKLEMKFDVVFRDPRQAIHQVCHSLTLPCGVEDFGQQLSTRLSFQVEPSTRTAQQVLDDVIRSHPQLRWSLSKGILEVKPKIHPKHDPLDRHLRGFSVKAMPSNDAMQLALRKAGLGPFTTATSGVPSTPTFPKISVETGPASVREILNRIAIADGTLEWSYAWVPSGEDTPRSAVFTIVSSRDDEPPARDFLGHGSGQDNQRP